MEILQKAKKDSLMWFPELGFGYFPVDLKRAPYNREYWERFVGYSKTEQGAKITQARMDFVRQHYQGPLVDVGIGCGDFTATRAARNSEDVTYGYDVNPIGIEWLRERNLWWDPYQKAIPAASFWDVLEHILEPKSLLSNVQQWIFLSAPIFKDLGDVLTSKHFKKDEHCWYWTPKGLALWMRHYGFEQVAMNEMESALGRVSIGSFAFRRRPAA